MHLFTWTTQLLLLSVPELQLWRCTILMCPSSATTELESYVYSAGEFGIGSAMQYGEADLQGRDFAQQVSM